MLSKITLQPKTEIETLQNTTAQGVSYEEDSNGNPHQMIFQLNNHNE